ncbi:MAG TPA: TIGR03118 family protein [Bryobacteraceae bacterium]|nr:TIGR03118 family protein [Bryobacteraceae bacterium]
MKDKMNSTSTEPVQLATSAQSAFAAAPRAQTTEPIQRAVLHISRVAALFTLLSGSLGAANQYYVHALVSDQPGIADLVDPNLSNPWGVDLRSAGAVLIGNNSTGMVKLYSAIPLAIGAANYTIPSPAGSGAAITSMVNFLFRDPDVILDPLFCTQDGSIVGVFAQSSGTPQNITIQPGTSIIIRTLVDNSASGAAYTGCAAGASQPGVAFFYAANFNRGTIDVFDSGLQPVANSAAFVDPAVPAGFAPFNLLEINGKLFVTYARQDAAKRTAVPGEGSGYLAVFDYSGNLLGTLVSQGPLDAPWGMAIAPSTFGDFGGMLLVGNSGDGRINVFDPDSGAFKGTLADTQNNPIAISGLRALCFGKSQLPMLAAPTTQPVEAMDALLTYGINGDASTLYFTAATAGPHGIFGSIQSHPVLQPDAARNGADFSTAIAPNTWISIIGESLSGGTRSWNTGDFVNNMLPTSLDEVSVTINGESAFVSYISPWQINALIPADLAPGPVQIQVSNHGLASDVISATLANAAPAFFNVGCCFGDLNEVFIAALHADNSPISSANMIGSANEGETIALFGTGFGATAPATPNGHLITTPLPLRQPAQISFNKCGALVSFTPQCSTVAQVSFAGLVAPGLYQISVTVPNDLTPEADPSEHAFPVAAYIFGVPTQAYGYLSVNTK